MKGDKLMIDFTNKTIFKLSKAKPESVTKEITPLMIAGEEIIGVYSSLRDHVVFTNKRIIAVNVQGMIGKKRDFTILPYSKVQTFSIETASTFDLDSELELHFSSLGSVKFEFTGSNEIIKIGQLISQYIL